MGIPKPIRCIFLVNRGPASDLYVNVLPLCFLCCIIPIARFMGPTWAHLGPTGPRWAPCYPHELCYLGCYITRPTLTGENVFLDTEIGAFI